MPIDYDMLPDFPEDESTLGWARHYRKCGLSIIPILIGVEEKPKHPALKWKRFQEHPATDAEVAEWFSDGGIFARGIGIVTGRVSGGLVMLEAESPEILAKLEEAMEAYGFGDLWRKLNLRVRSGGGGTHLYYRCPDACGANVKLALKPKDAGGSVLIETRGEGGYVVAAGSPPQTHESGNPYELVSGGFDRIPVLNPEEQEELFLVARRLDERPDQEALVLRSIPTDLGDQGRPGDDFNSTCTAEQLAELLEAHGWHGRRTTRMGYLLTRPGKLAKDGNSASVFPPDGTHPAMFYCFSSSGDFEPGAYSPFSVYAELEHRGNYSEAAAELRRRGYGEPINSINSINPNRYGGGGGGSLDPLNPLNPRGRGGVEGVNNTTEILSILNPTHRGGGNNGFNGINAAFEPSDPWDADFYDLAGQALPAWPEAPSSIASTLKAREFAEGLGVPLSLFGPIQLALIAACTQRRVRVAHPNGYREPLCLWTCSVGEPGSRKSEVVRALQEPLNQIETESNEQTEHERQAYQGDKRIADGRLKSIERKLQDCDFRDKPEQFKKLKEDLGAARDELEMLEEKGAAVRYVRLTMKDFTPEVLDLRMWENGSRLTILDSEAQVFHALSSPRGNSYANSANVCSYYSEEDVRVDRKGTAESGSSYYSIESPVLTMGLTTQRFKLERMLANGSLSGEGFAVRFLYSWVEDFNPPYYTIDISPIRASWDRLVLDLWENLPESKPRGQAAVVYLGKEAEELHHEYHHQLIGVKSLASDAMKSWLGKAAGTCLRIAANLHLALHRGKGLDVEIAGETMGYAIELMRYFEAHSRVAFDRSSEQRAFGFVQALAHNSQALKACTEKEDGCVVFSRITKAFHASKPEEQERLESGMASLEAIGWARQLKRTKETKGPTGKRWQIRPEALRELERIAAGIVRSKEPTA
jgi:hypothetical protein